MELYDPIIRDTLNRLSPLPAQRWAYRPADAWADAGESELVLLRDAAYELGGSGAPAVNYACVTADRALAERDEVVLIGPDLPQLRADGPYARIALLRVEDLGGGTDPNETYRAVRDIEFSKYHVFPRGFMVRMSAESCREQVRVSKAALRRGLSFYRVGCDFIRAYRNNPRVRAVKLFFLTDPAAPYAALLDNAKKADDITRALNNILEGMPADCTTCRLKPVCDEVEGMRELHFGAGRSR